MPSQRSALALALSNRAEGRRRGEARTRRRQVDARGRPGKTPKDSAIATLLDDLRDLKSADIAAEPAKDLPAWGLDHPDLRIALTDKEGQPIGTVLAAKHDGKPYVMRAGSEIVFEARDYMYARLDKQPKDLVEEPGAAAATTTTEPSAEPEPGEPMDDGDDAEDGAD